MGYFRQAPDRVAYGPWFVHVTTDEVEDGVFTAFIVLFVIQLLLLPLQRWSMATLARQIGIAYMIFVGYIIVSKSPGVDWPSSEACGPGPGPPCTLLWFSPCSDSFLLWRAGWAGTIILY